MRGRRPVQVTPVSDAEVHEATVVYGIAFSPEEAEVASLTRRVVHVSILFMVIAALQFLMSLVEGNGSGALFSLLLSSLMPMCGYYGAKNKDRNLVCMFWGTNLVSMLCSALMVLVGVLSLMAINMEAQHCLDTAEPIGWTNSSAGHARHTWEADLQRDDPIEPRHQQVKLKSGCKVQMKHANAKCTGKSRNTCDCKCWVSMDANTWQLWVVILFYGSQAILAAFAYYNGKLLCNSPYFDPSGPGGMDGAPVGTARVVAQPQIVVATVVSCEQEGPPQGYVPSARASSFSATAVNPLGSAAARASSPAAVSVARATPVQPSAITATAILATASPVSDDVP